MASPNNAVSMFDATAVNRPQIACMVGAHSRWTYTQAHALSCRIAQAILRIRLGRAPRVAVLATNQPVSYVALLGVLRAGAAAISLHWMVDGTPHTDAPLTVDSDLIFYTSEYAQHVQRIVAVSPKIKIAICLDDADAHGTALSEWLINVPARDPEMPTAIGDAALFSRRGEVALDPCSHRDLRTLTHEHIVSLTRGDTRPVYLSAGVLGPGALQMSLVASSLGGTLVALSNAQSGTILSAIPRYGVTQLFLPRRSLESVLNDPVLASIDLSSLKQVTYRGDELPAATIARAREVFGPILSEAFFYASPVARSLQSA